MLCIYIRLPRRCVPKENRGMYESQPIVDFGVGGEGDIPAYEAAWRINGCVATVQSWVGMNGGKYRPCIDIHEFRTICGVPATSEYRKVCLWTWRGPILIDDVERVRNLFDKVSVDFERLADEITFLCSAIEKKIFRYDFAFGWGFHEIT